MRSGQDYINLMRHALGKVPDSRLDLWAALNDSGRKLYTCAEVKPWFHTWTWAVRVNQTISVPANEPRFRLEDNFGEVLDVDYASSQTGKVVIVGPEELARLRRSQITPTAVMYVCFDRGSAQKNRAQPMPREAEVWPVQSARVDLRLTSQQMWRELDSGSPNDLPLIPVEWEALLVLIARSWAWKLANSSTLADEAEIPAEIDRLVTFDTNKQTFVGRPNHSVMASARRSGRMQYPHARITKD